MKSLVISLMWLLLWFTPVKAGQMFQYEIIGRFNEDPGNLTVTPGGRIIMSLHQFYQPRYSVVELLPDNSLVPFPNKKLNNRKAEDGLRLD